MKCRTHWYILDLKLQGARTVLPSWILMSREKSLGNQILHFEMNVWEILAIFRSSRLFPLKIWYKMTCKNASHFVTDHFPNVLILKKIPFEIVRLFISASPFTLLKSCIHSHDRSSWQEVYDANSIWRDAFLCSTPYDRENHLR